MQLSFLVLLLLAVAGQAADRDTIYQTAPIDALLAGVYDGDYAVGDLKQHGDIGIGALNALDGELVCVDGQMFQIRVDGKVCPVPDSALDVVLDPSSSIYLALPGQGDFSGADLSVDRQQELMRVESSPK